MGRAATDLAEGLRRLPRLIESLQMMAERERQTAEAELKAPPPPRPRRRLGFAEAVAVLALIAAIVAWWH
jgi:ubiquinone biosynthesis protein